MNKICKELIRGAVIGFAVPALLLTGVVWAAENIQPDGSGPGTTEQSASTSHSASSAPGLNSGIFLPVLTDSGLISMDLEQYVLGVVLAEMPASFEPEALKAQAVAARTYGLKIHSDGYKHADHAVCTNYACCQGYLSQEDYLNKGWSQAQLDKVMAAVRQTAGEILTYEGSLIAATYFACSGGTTESAAAVWGQDVPYLQAVESPGEEETVYFLQTKSFSPEEFQKALGVRLEGSPETWFGIAKYTSGGGVDTIEICAVPYRGTTLRTLLGLRSTNFRVFVTETEIVFETRGYGHRVGMSQYGADALAMEGKHYQQILQHYYRGTELVKLDAAN